MSKKLGYIRVSTDKQNIDRQLVALKGECDEVFIEYATSANAKKRPVFDKVMATLRPGDVFVVCALDRAFRSVLSAMKALEQLGQRDIEFRSLTQDFDTTTPHGKLLFTIAAALAAWEREMLSQRTKEGMDAARRKGKQIGRPRKLDDPQIAKARRMIKQQNASIEELALELDVHQITLERALAG